MIAITGPMPGFFRSMIIDIGHADMAADPDYVGAYLER
ncbi:MAG: hypothetical protein IRD7MM_06610 [Candidatus Midichloria mitochondrii]